MRCFCLIALCLTAAAETIHVNGWDYADATLEWHPWAKPDEQQAAGTLNAVMGWAEYTFEVPAGGWYELFQVGIPPEWPRDLFIDGKLAFYHQYADREDVVPEGRTGWVKDGNYWFAAGPHTLRWRRTAFPGCLPMAWELRTADDRPEACIRVVGVDHNVLRAGEELDFTLRGGGPTPFTCELVLRDTATGELLPVGEVTFPAVDTPVEQTVRLRFPREGRFALLPRVDGNLGRPADLKAGFFYAVDTAAAPAPAAALETTPLIDIDCVAQTINGQPVEPGVNYFENRCRTAVVERPWGRYRELTPDPTRLAPSTATFTEKERADRDVYLARNRAKWGGEAFAYKFDLPEAHQLYRLLVDYPDDDRRTMGFHLSDFPATKGGWIQGGGVETGDHYLLSHSMRTHEAYFYCREPRGLVLPVVNLLPGWKAAAARLRIERVDGLPAAPGASRGRLMGFYFEEPGRWSSYFGGDPELKSPFATMERWAQWNRYLGSNLLYPSVMVYNGIMWPSRAAHGWGTMAAEDTPRMLALVAEKYGQQFVPEIHMAQSHWFSKYQFGLAYDEATETVQFLQPDSRDVVLYDLDGRTRTAWMKYVVNALHPRVQEKYLDLVGELADNLGDSPAFAGISSRLMISWQWGGWNALPGLKYGYGDWTIAQFTAATGIAVPGEPDDPGRFRQRFDYLTGPRREAWLDWRCQRVFAYHCRLRDRIQQAKPGTRLFLTWFSPEKECLADDMLGMMREAGLDPRLYENEPGIVVIQGGMYGRRYSSPITDARVVEPSLYDPDAKEVGRWGDRGYSLYTSYFEYGRTTEYDRLGGKDTFINDCCVPSDFNERELYAIALADCDTSFFINGGAGWMFGTPRIMEPFLHEYRALPAMPMTPLETARDPVAVWSGEGDGKTWFYAVNRLPVSVTVDLTVKGWFAKVFAAGDGARLELAGKTLRFELAPYMLKSFYGTGRGFALDRCRTTVPDDFVLRAARTAAFAREASMDLKQRRVVPEWPTADVDEVVSRLDAAVDGFAVGEFWHAWRIDSLPLVRLYCALGRFPPGMWDRSIPHGLVAAPDAPELAATSVLLGAGHGRLTHCQDLAVDADGTLWVTDADQLVGGTAARALRLFRPPDSGTELPFPTPLQHRFVVPLPGERLAVPGGHDFLRPYDSRTGRALVPTAAGGVPMTPQDRPVGAGPRGNIYVSRGRGAVGVYKYRADGSPAYDFPGDPPGYRLTDAPATGGAVDESGRIFLAPAAGGYRVFARDGAALATVPGEPLGLLAVDPPGDLVVTARGSQLRAFRNGEPAWDCGLPAEVTALAFLAPTRLAVGYKNPDPEGAVVRALDITPGGAEPAAVLVGGTAAVAARSLGGFTQLKVHNGAVHYLAHGKLWALRPGEDSAALAYAPPPGHGFDAFAFAPNGDLYLASHYRGAARGVNLYRARGTGELEYLNDGKPVYEAWYMVPTDLAVAADGRLVVRLYDDEDNPHGKRVSLFLWDPETRAAERLLVVGDSTVRYGEYGLYRLADGGWLVAGGTTRALWRLAADGTPAWHRAMDPHYLPGAFDSRDPMGIAMDSRGRVWVADTARNHVLCLTGAGDLLGVYGHFGTTEDTSGLGMAGPVGIAAVTDADGAEHLYVADVGNRRLLHWRLDEADR